jgi:hypothetical protein
MGIKKVLVGSIIVTRFTTCNSDGCRAKIRYLKLNILKDTGKWSSKGVLLEKDIDRTGYYLVKIDTS